MKPIKAVPTAFFFSLFTSHLSLVTIHCSLFPSLLSLLSFPFSLFTSHRSFVSFPSSIVHGLSSFFHFSLFTTHYSFSYQLSQLFNLLPDLPSSRLSDFRLPSPCSLRRLPQQHLHFLLQRHDLFPFYVVVMSVTAPRISSLQQIQ